MSVIKQNILTEKVKNSMIHDFIVRGTSLNPSLRHIDVELLEKAILSGLPEDYDGNDLLTYLSETASQFTYKSYDYALLAGRLEMLDLYKKTPDTFKEAMNSISSLLLPEFV